ncbi:MAG TPA: hypothetical protein VGN11_01515 [Candidatus Baltobacteraceae bacterium]|nr:hypothetical protein [Candidatus Baltobacteraceae bacterium]
MKVPYREHLWYALPLGDGSFARACIMRAYHHVVDIAALNEHGTVLAALRVTDRALVLHRWKRIDDVRLAPDVAVENDAWIGAALAERIVARRAGKLPFEERPRTVRVLRPFASLDSFAAPAPGGGDTMFTWSRPLDAATLDAVGEYVELHPRTALRPYGAAVPQVRDCEALRPRILHLTAPLERRLCFDRVESLHLEAAMNVRETLTAFPALRALRVAARIDLNLDGFGEGITTLDCSGLHSITARRPLASLRMLRVARCSSTVDLASLAPAMLSTLAVEHCRIAEIDAMLTLRLLRQVELQGFWQFEIADIEPLLAMPSLLRALVDIGGRRKNIELYKRASWAYPWPLSSGAGS